MALPLAALSTPTPLPTQEGTVLLTGTVRAAESAEPLERALVVVREQGKGTLTDGQGRFALAELDPGTVTLDVRYLGRTSSTAEVELVAGEITRVELLLTADPVELPELTVETERRVPTKMAGFWERRRQGIGHFITREDLEKIPGSLLSRAFRPLPGIRVSRCPPPAPSSCARVRSKRSLPSFSNSGRPCFPTYYVDGALVEVNKFPRGLNEYRPYEVEGVEVYSGPSQIPARWAGSNSRCGVVVIWTRS